MKKVKFLYDKVMEITGQVGKDHVGAYAAQAAYFFMLSLIPIILLLITLVQYTPVTKADVMTAVLQVFPKSVDSLITSIVNQVYNQSGGITDHYRCTLVSRERCTGTDDRSELRLRL